MFTSRRELRSAAVQVKEGSMTPLEVFKSLRRHWRKVRKGLRSFQYAALQQVYEQVQILWRDKEKRSAFLKEAGKSASDNGPPIEDLFRWATEFCEPWSSKKVSQKHARALLALHRRSVPPGKVAGVLEREKIEKLARSLAGTHKRPVSATHQPVLRWSLPSAVSKALEEGGRVKVSIVIERTSAGKFVVLDSLTNEVSPKSINESQVHKW